MTVIYIRLVTSNNVIFTTTPDIKKPLSIVYKADYFSVILATASHTIFFATHQNIMNQNNLITSRYLLMENHIIINSKEDKHTYLHWFSFFISYVRSFRFALLTMDSGL